MSGGTIVVVGSVNMDLVMPVPHFPRAGETVLGGAFRSACGGKGANQAVAAARAGAAVAFIGAVGDDAHGVAGRAALEAEGCGALLVTRREAPTGAAFIFVDEAGESCIAVSPGANALLRVEDVEHAWRTLADVSVVLIQMEIPIDVVAVAARLGASAGAIVILNPAPAAPIADEILRDVTLLTPNEGECATLIGRERLAPGAWRDAADVLLARGASGAVLTLGAAGAFVRTRELADLIDAIPVRPVDTTAAGDTFNGALAAELDRGHDLLDAVQYANAAAAICVTRAGAQPSIPTHRQVEALLAERRSPLTLSRGLQ